MGMQKKIYLQADRRNLQFALATCNCQTIRTRSKWETMHRTHTMTHT